MLLMRNFSMVLHAFRDGFIKQQRLCLTEGVVIMNSSVSKFVPYGTSLVICISLQMTSKNATSFLLESYVAILHVFNYTKVTKHVACRTMFDFVKCFCNVDVYHVHI